MGIFSATYLQCCLDQYAPCHAKILTVQLPGSHQHFLKLSSRKSKLRKELILLQMMLALPVTPKIEKSTEIPTEMSHSEVKLSYLKQLVLQTKHNPHSAADLPMVRCEQCYWSISCWQKHHHEYYSFVRLNQ